MRFSEIRKEIYGLVASIIEPPPERSAATWADQERHLPAGSPEPGPWRSNRTPFMVPFLEACSDPRYSTIIFSCGSQMGKALPLDTPIFTPDGWKTLDGITGGSVVFGAEGSQVTVLYDSKVMHDHDCFDVYFSDGSVVKADADHLWTVEDYINKRKMRVTTLSTLEISKTFKFLNGKRNRYAIKINKPLSMGNKDLLIDPYLLGAWLGDGHSCSARIFQSADDSPHMQKQILEAGHSLRVNVTNCHEIMIDPQNGKNIPNSFAKRLTALELVKNKHIPVCYLTSSYGQRLALLQGMMDTDGHVETGRAGRCEYTTVSKHIADGFGDLLATMGIKHTVSMKFPTCNYKGVKVKGKPAFKFSFLVYNDNPIFRLKRKLECLPGKEGRRPWETCRRRIVEVIKSKSVPVKCIKVDAVDSLFLAGRKMVPTHNTENILNIVGHRFTDGPFVPALLVFPTEKLARSMSNDRFKKMVASTKILYERLEKGHANKVMEKFFGGIRCGFAYAGSATELSSHPAGIVVIDEIDRMDDVSGEGDPYLLAKARTKNYTDSKVVVTSTPTITDASRITKLFESGTMGRWAWECIHCNIYFVPEFSCLKWDDGGTVDECMKSATVVCPQCGGIHTTKHKNKLNANGKYIFCEKDSSGGYRNIEGEAPKNPTASFWASGLASPWQSFEDIVYIVVMALNSKDQGTIQGAMNTYLGECYTMRGDAPAWERVKTHVRDYRDGDPPEDVQLITCGVDVQSDRLYYCIRGYGFKQESWLLEHGALMGDTAKDKVWEKLGELVKLDFAGMKISRCFVDSGYTPGRGGNRFVRPDNMIYIFCRLTMGLCFPTKGRDMMDKPTKTSKIDVTVSGRTLKGGMTLWQIDTDFFKRQIYSNIRRSSDAKRGWHVHLDIDDEYCKQVTSEECITSEKGKRSWIQTRRDNHFLDCEVLCDAAAYTAGVADLKIIERKKPEKSTTKNKESQNFVPQQEGSFFRR